MTRYGSENAEPSLIENAKWDLRWQEIWTSIKFIEKNNNEKTLALSFEPFLW